MCSLIKVIAVISMLVDHTGSNFFPDITALRIIGRLSLPLFACWLCSISDHRSRSPSALTIVLAQV